MFSGVDRITACDGKTDGQTGRRTDIWRQHSPRYAYASRGKKKSSGNFGYMGRSNLWCDLDQMWHVGRRNQVCNIW